MRLQIIRLSHSRIGTITPALMASFIVAIQLGTNAIADEFVLTERQLDRVTAGSAGVFADGDASAIATMTGVADTRVDSDVVPAVAVVAVEASALGDERASVEAIADAIADDGATAALSDGLASAASGADTVALAVLTNGVAIDGEHASAEGAAITNADTGFATVEVGATQPGEAGAIGTLAYADGASVDGAAAEAAGSTETVGGTQAALLARSAGDDVAVAGTVLEGTVVVGGATIATGAASEGAGFGEGAASRSRTVQRTVEGRVVSRVFLFSGARARGAEGSVAEAGSTIEVLDAPEGTRVVLLTRDGAGRASSTDAARSVSAALIFNTPEPGAGLAGVQRLLGVLQAQRGRQRGN